MFSICVCVQEKTADTQSTIVDTLGVSCRSWNAAPKGKESYYLCCNVQTLK